MQADATQLELLLRQNPMPLRMFLIDESDEDYHFFEAKAEPRNKLATRSNTKWQSRHQQWGGLPTKVTSDRACAFVHNGVATQREGCIIQHDETHTTNIMTIHWCLWCWMFPRVATGMAEGAIPHLVPRPVAS